MKKRRVLAKANILDGIVEKNSECQNSDYPMICLVRSYGGRAASSFCNAIIRELSI
ncbi:MAG TPA: hypothetical protein VFI64_04265 [Nitrososphaeraceae archaeon]|nr:hypothetical protein [Nitrososphaeraceae archaeon]